MKIFDLHNDYPTSREGLDRSFYPHTVVHAFWTSEIIEPLDYIKNYIDTSLHRCNRIYAVEDLWFVECEKTLKEICKLPIIYASLTWNDANSLAGGANTKGGLTEWGKQVVRSLIKSNIAIDTAHLNRQSFFDVIDLIKKSKTNKKIKILNSHTCLNSIFNHPRNLTDEQVKAIISLNGIIGLTPVAQFMLSDPLDSNRTDFVRQIDIFIQKFGADNLAIGTDFFGAPTLKGLLFYDDFELVAQDLLRLGYDKEIIAKIFYKNAHEFCLQA